MPMLGCTVRIVGKMAIRAQEARKHLDLVSLSTHDLRNGHGLWPIQAAVIALLRSTSDG